MSLKINLKYYEGYPVIKEIKEFLNPAEEFILGPQVYQKRTFRTCYFIDTKRCDE